MGEINRGASEGTRRRNREDDEREKRKTKENFGRIVNQSWLRIDRKRRQHRRRQHKNNDRHAARRYETLPGFGQPKLGQVCPSYTWATAAAAFSTEFPDKTNKSAEEQTTKDKRNLNGLLFVMRVGAL